MSNGFVLNGMEGGMRVGGWMVGCLTIVALWLKGRSYRLFYQVITKSLSHLIILISL